MPRSYTIHEDGTVEVHSSAGAAPDARVETAQPGSKRYDTLSWHRSCRLCGASHGPVAGRRGAPFCQTVAGALRLRLTKCPDCSLFVESIYRHQPSCRKVARGASAPVVQEPVPARAAQTSRQDPIGKMSGRERARLKKAQKEQMSPVVFDPSSVQGLKSARQTFSSKTKLQFGQKCPLCQARPKNLTKHLRKVHQAGSSGSPLAAKQSALPEAADERVPAPSQLRASAATGSAGRPLHTAGAPVAKDSPMSAMKPAGRSLPHSELPAVASVIVDDITVCVECGLFVVVSMLPIHNRARHEGPAVALPTASVGITATQLAHEPRRSDNPDSPSGACPETAQQEIGGRKSGTRRNQAGGQKSDARGHPGRTWRDKRPHVSRHRGGGSDEPAAAKSLPAPDVPSPPEREVFIDPWTGKPMSAAVYQRLYPHAAPQRLLEHPAYSEKGEAPEPAPEHKEVGARRAGESSDRPGTHQHDSVHTDEAAGRRIEPAPAIDQAPLDGSLRLGYLAREQGRFGSLGSWDNYSDDSKP